MFDLYFISSNIRYKNKKRRHTACKGQWCASTSVWNLTRRRWKALWPINPLSICTNSLVIYKGRRLPLTVPINCNLQQRLLNYTAVTFVAFVWQKNISHLIMNFVNYFSIQKFLITYNTFSLIKKYFKLHNLQIP